MIAPANNTPPQQPTSQSPDAAIKAYQRFGMICLYLLIGGIGGWSVLATLQGAVIAPGTITVKANVKRIQHLEGGIISEILIEEGERVTKGQPLLRLDRTRDAANLAALDSNLNELKARHARLLAERDKKDIIPFDEALLKQASDNAEIKDILDGQRNLKKAREATINGQITQLEQRITELHEVIKGLSAQSKSKLRQLELISKEHDDLLKLKAKGLVPQTRLLALEREKARLEGEHGELIANTARTKLQIHETNLQILQIEKETFATLLTELRDIAVRTNQLKEQRTALTDKLKRMEIKAPESGYVHNLAVNTIGGVVSPGDPVLMIVPEKAELIIAAKVNPSDIDQLHKGQRATVRLTAFDQRTTPEITGLVSLIPGDAITDQQGAPPYYKVHLHLPKEELAKLTGKTLIPGMQSEVYIETKSRPVFEYLLQPLTDQIRRAMRES